MDTKKHDLTYGTFHVDKEKFSFPMMSAKDRFYSICVYISLVYNGSRKCSFTCLVFGACPYAKCAHRITGSINDS